MTIYDAYTKLIKKAEELKSKSSPGSFSENEANEAIARMTKTRDSFPPYVANSKYVPLKGAKKL